MIENNELQILLTMFKATEGIKSNKLENDVYIPRIKFSIQELQRMGIILDFSKTEDQLLIVDYACWLYEGGNSQKPLPLHIKMSINNRFFSLEKTNNV